MTDNLPATTLATGNDHVTLNYAWWKRLLVLGGLTAFFWHALRRKSRGSLGVSYDEESDDVLWSRFYQSELQQLAAKRRGAEPPTNFTFQPELSAAQARDMLLSRFPKALDEPGIEEGSPVAPVKVHMPFDPVQLEREGEEALQEKRRAYAREHYKKNREKLIAYSRAYRAAQQATPEQAEAFKKKKRAADKADYAALSPEKKRARSKRNRERDPDKTREYARLYAQREDVKDKIRAYQKAYAQTPEGKAKIAARQRAYQARKKAEREKAKAEAAELEARRRDYD